MKKLKDGISYLLNLKSPGYIATAKTTKKAHNEAQHMIKTKDTNFVVGKFNENIPGVPKKRPTFDLM